MARLIEPVVIGEHINGRKKVKDGDRNNLTEDEIKARVTKDILQVLNTGRASSFLHAAAEMLSPLLESYKETSDALDMCSTQELRDRLGQELKWYRQRTLHERRRGDIQSVMEKVAREAVKSVNQKADEFNRTYSEVDLGYIKAIKKRWTEIRDYQAKGATALEDAQWLLEGCKGELGRLEEMKMESITCINEEKQCLDKGPLECALADHLALRKIIAKELTESFAKVKILFPVTRNRDGEALKEKAEAGVRSPGSEIHASSKGPPLVAQENSEQILTKGEKMFMKDGGIEMNNTIMDNEEFDGEIMLVKSEAIGNKNVIMQNNEAKTKKAFVERSKSENKDIFTDGDEVEEVETKETAHQSIISVEEPFPHSPTVSCNPTTEDTDGQDTPRENMPLSRSTSSSDVTELIFEHESRSSSRSGMRILTPCVLGLSESASSCRSGVSKTTRKLLPSKPQWTRKLVNNKKEVFADDWLRATCPWRLEKVTKAVRYFGTVPVHELSLYGELSESFIDQLEEQRLHTLRAQHLPSQLSKGLAATYVLGSDGLIEDVSIETEKATQCMAASSIPSTRESRETLHEALSLEYKGEDISGEIGNCLSNEALCIRGNGVTVKMEAAVIPRAHSVTRRAPAVEGPERWTQPSSRSGIRGRRIIR